MTVNSKGMVKTYKDAIAYAKQHYPGMDWPERGVYATQTMRMIWGITPILAEGSETPGEWVLVKDNKVVMMRNLGAPTSNY